VSSKAGTPNIGINIGANINISNGLDNLSTVVSNPINLKKPFNIKLIYYIKEKIKTFINKHL
jgi:hypothetical protein